MAEKTLLLDSVAKLSPRERFIMEKRFGLNGEKELTQKEVADLIGISQSYISRLEKRIIKRLKKVDLMHLKVLNGELFLAELQVE